MSTRLREDRVCLRVLLVMRTLVISILACFVSKSFSIKGKEWLAVISSGMIKGPMAYIFGNVLVPDRVPCVDVKDHHQYDKSFPLFVLQITVLISLVILTPLNHLVFKLAVSKEEVEDKREDDTKTTSLLKKSLLKDEWILDKNKPKVFTYADEFLLKPLFIRDYFQRKVVLFQRA